MMAKKEQYCFNIARELNVFSLHRGGSVVYISSIGGYQPLAALGAYSVSKTALLGLTKAVAVDAVTSNIRVNCVCPGVIQTKFSSALWNDPSVADEVNKTIPMHRYIGMREM